MKPLTFQKLCKDFGVALTGGVASGKSTVASILRQLGYVVVDADQVSRLVVAPGTEGLGEVVAAFGKEILNSAGEMDRAKMRQIIFQSEDKRRLLEGIIHKRLNAATADIVEREGLNSSPRPWFYEASLIFERKRETDFHSVWVAYCPEELQIERLIRRDASTRESALAILGAQMPTADKRVKADLVIDTDCSLIELVDRVKEALRSQFPQHENQREVTSGQKTPEIKPPKG